MKESWWCSRGDKGSDGFREPLQCRLRGIKHQVYVVTMLSSSACCVGGVALWFSHFGRERKCGTWHSRELPWSLEDLGGFFRCFLWLPWPWMFGQLPAVYLRSKTTQLALLQSPSVLSASGGTWIICGYFWRPLDHLNPPHIIVVGCLPFDILSLIRWCIACLQPSQVVCCRSSLWHTCAVGTPSAEWLCRFLAQYIAGYAYIHWFHLGLGIASFSLGILWANKHSYIYWFNLGLGTAI